jgi:hypothetical protein
MKEFLMALFLAIPTLIMGQQESAQSFEIQVSTDTILLGNFFEVRFLVQNAKGAFDPPAFTDFDVVGGPNQSSSMSIVNGVSSQSSSYSYFLKPKSTFLLGSPGHHHGNPPLRHYLSTQSRRRCGRIKNI